MLFPAITDGNGTTTLSVAGIDLTPEDVTELKEVFNELDTDGNGSLDREEFRQFMVVANKEGLSDRIFSVVDDDQNGVVSFDEFVAFLVAMVEITEEKDGTRYMKMLFNACDKGNKGYLTKEEFVQWTDLADAKIEEEQREQHFKEWDADGDGKITLEEVVSKFNLMIS